MYVYFEMFARSTLTPLHSIMAFCLINIETHSLLPKREILIRGKPTVVRRYIVFYEML